MAGGVNMAVARCVQSVSLVNWIVACICNQKGYIFLMVCCFGYLKNPLVRDPSIQMEFKYVRMYN